MAYWRCTFTFGTVFFRASETYVSNDMDLAALSGPLQGLIDKRNAMLSTDIQWISVRISDTASLRRGRPFPPGAYNQTVSGIDLRVPGQGVLDNLTPSGKTDQARSCLQVKVRFNSDRFTTRYLAFVPDELVSSEKNGITFGKVPDFANAWDQWQPEVSSGRWNILALPRTSEFAVSTIMDWVLASPAPANMGVQLDAGSSASYVAGDKIRILSVRRKGTDSLSYNGTYYVAGTNPTPPAGTRIVYLRGTSGGDPASIKRLGKAQKVGKVIPVTIAAYSPVRVGIHKRGNSSGSGRGRRSRRASLDP